MSRALWVKVVWLSRPFKFWTKNSWVIEYFLILELYSFEYSGDLKSDQSLDFLKEGQISNGLVFFQIVGL